MAATAVEEPGIEAVVLRKIAPYSLLMLLAVCLYTFAACSGWLDFYLPHFKSIPGHFQLRQYFRPGMRPAQAGRAFARVVDALVHWLG